MEINEDLINKICEGSATDKEIEKYIDLMNNMMETEGYLDTLKNNIIVKISEGTATDKEIEQWAEKHNIPKDDINITIAEMKKIFLDGIEFGPEIVFKKSEELSKKAYIRGDISFETLIKVVGLGPPILTKDPEIEKLWPEGDEEKIDKKNVTELDKDEIIISLTCVLDQLDSIKDNVNMLLQVLDTETNKCIECGNTTCTNEKCISLKNERVQCIGCGYETETFYNHYCGDCCPENICGNTTSNNKKCISLENEIDGMTDEQIKEKYDHSLYIIDEEY